MKNIQINRFELAGKTHKEKCAPCQDKTFVVCESGKCVIALADGAGSLRQAERGAEIAAKTGGTSLFNALQNDATCDNIRAKIIGDVYQQLIKESDNNNIPVYEYGSTLLILGFTQNDMMTLFHLGDGAIVAWGKHFFDIISYPSNYMSEKYTFLTTAYQNKSRIKIKSGKMISDAQGYLIMSDGVFSAMYDNCKYGINETYQELLRKRRFDLLNARLCGNNVVTDDMSYIACSFLNKNENHQTD